MNQLVRRVLIVVASLLLVGCATLANTPAQERGYAAYERCKSLLPPDSRLMRIEPDGRVWIYGSAGREAFFACYRRA